MFDVRKSTIQLADGSFNKAGMNLQMYLVQAISLKKRQCAMSTILFCCQIYLCYPLDLETHHTIEEVRAQPLLRLHLTDHSVNIAISVSCPREADALVREQ